MKRNIKGGKFDLSSSDFFGIIFLGGRCGLFFRGLPVTTPFAYFRDEFLTRVTEPVNAIWRQIWVGAGIRSETAPEHVSSLSYAFS